MRDRRAPPRGCEFIASVVRVRGARREKHLLSFSLFLSLFLFFQEGVCLGDCVPSSKRFGRRGCHKWVRNFPLQVLAGVGAFHRDASARTPPLPSALVGVGAFHRNASATEAESTQPQQQLAPFFGRGGLGSFETAPTDRAPLGSTRGELANDMSHEDLSV